MATIDLTNRRLVANYRMQALTAQLESMRCFRLGLFTAASHWAQQSDQWDAKAQRMEQGR